MIINYINNTHAIIISENGYLGARKYKTKVHSDKYGYASVTPSKV